MDETLNVLVVEDSEDDVLLLVRHLRQNGLHPAIQRVETAESLRTALRTSQWDVILCDASMPSLGALGALDEVKSVGIDVPFIVVSGAVPEEHLVELMKAGAHDVVVKDRLSRLVPAIEREIAEATVRRERRQIESQLQVAIESMSEGFTLHDSEDRLVICNDIFRRMHDKSADLIVPGVTFEEIVRGGAERGQYKRESGEVEEFVRERMALHRACAGPFEQELSDGRWMLIDERRTRDGGTVGIRTDITALKNAQKELRDGEQFLRLIVDNLPIMIAYFDADQRYRFVNHTATTWYARAEKEIVGKTVAQVLGKAGYAGLKTHLDGALEGDGEAFEASVNFPDGVTRQIQGIHVPDRDDENVVRGFVAMATDITERHLAESALREREEFIRIVGDNVADAVITINERCEIESFNRSAERVFGYSADEVRGRNVSMLMPEPYRSQHDDYVASYYKTGRGTIFGVGPRELVGTRKDGSTFPLELSLGEARQGKRRVFIGSVRDLSTQRRSEFAIRESEERFRVAFEAAPHGIALVGLDGRWLKVNHAVTEMLGYEEQELLSLNFQTVTHPDDLAADIDLVRQVLDGKIPNYQLEKRYVRKDGRIVPTLLSVSLVRDSNGSPLHFVSQLLDLTEREEIEAQLIQAQKMEAVGQLTGGVAHDFNNLLTIIIGNVRLLERRLSDGDAVTAKNLAAIAGAARRGADLTHRLLAFSRKEKLEPRVIDGRELVSGMLDMLQRTLGEAIKIETRFSDEPLGLLADPNQLENALLNLATNARDAMPEGGTLTIALETDQTTEKANRGSDPRTATGEYVVVSVSDTGSGISAEHRDKIFEPFFTTKDVGKGTGLGLSMVFGFVKQSGGHITAESREGHGTTFCLYLRRAETSASLPPGAEAAPSRESANGQRTILVVEDETEVRAIAVAILEDLGYRVAEAPDGPNALAMLEEQPDIDLLFTDMIMPGGMTGHELATMAKRRRPDLKVLYTSGYTDDALESVPPEPGHGLALLRKPYEDASLAEMVRQALGGIS